MRAEGAAARHAPRYYNSVVAIDDGGEIIDAVDKVHLVPFGEYLPFADCSTRFGIDQHRRRADELSRPARQRHPIALPAGCSAVPFICYEIIFPDELMRG